MRNNRPIFFIIILSLIGMISLLFVTRWGAGLTPDSTIYIAAARNLLNGVGLSTLSGSQEPIPLTVYPPLFPFLLSLIGIFGPDPLNAVRWFNTFLFGANIILVGFIINKYAANSIWSPIFGAFLILTSTVMFEVHSMALAEPLFIFFSLLGLFYLSTYIDNPKLPLLVISSSAIALAFLTRYVGITLAVAGIVAILFLNRANYYTRIRDVVIFIGISSFPMALWTIRNLSLAGTATGGKIGFHPLTFTHIRVALSTVSIWLLPETLPAIIRGIILALLFVSLLAWGARLLAKKKMGSSLTFINSYWTKFSYLLVIFIFTYAIFLLISISFFSLHTSLDTRTLAPVYVFGLVFIICLIDNMLTYLKANRLFNVISIVICIALAGSYLLRAISWISRTSADGQGYASYQWRHSQIIEEVNKLPPQMLIFSNGVDVIYILNSRAAAWIPAKINTADRQMNRKYLSELAKMENQLENQKAVIVYFKNINRWYLPSEDELKRQLSLQVLAVGADGVIYRGRE